MDVRLKLNENIFTKKNGSDDEKKKTYARVVDIGGKAYFNVQFEIDKVPKDSSTISDEYRDTKEIDDTLFLPNTYDNGIFKLDFNREKNTSLVTIIIQVSSKAPGGSGIIGETKK